MSEQGAVDEATDDGKKVIWAELFFDLVFVVAVTRVSELLVEDHTWGGLLRALVVFVPMYWLWVGTSIQSNQQDTGSGAMRLRLFAVALAALFMALALPEAYGRLGLLFAAAYWFGRIVLGVGLVFSALSSRRWPVNPFAVSMLLTGWMMVVGALLESGPREVVWGVAALIDLSTPTLLRRGLQSIRYDAGHLSERFGLFVLIALGESLVAVGTSAEVETLTWAQGLAIAAAFAMCCGLWWVYFAFAADAMRFSLATAKVQLDITRLVLSYGHLLFIAGIVLVAVGLHETVQEPTHHLSWPVTGLLYGGCALYLSGFGFTRWAMFRLVSRTRLTTAAVVLVLLPFAPHVPALASLVVLAVVLAALNLVEWQRNAQIGWRALRGRTLR